MAGMSMMEHPEPTISVPPLVDDHVLVQFFEAVQDYADGVGLHDEAAASLRLLRNRLDTLRNLAVLCRLAIVGNPDSLARVTEEMNCVAIDFPADPLPGVEGDGEPHEDEPDTRAVLTAAIDLFAGASFASKDKPEQRDRFIIGIVRAIEDAIGFPTAVASEAAAYLGDAAPGQAPLHAVLVIANATSRLIESDRKCVPRVPWEIRRRLHCLARMWMRKNPVDEFFNVISGPKVRRIVHWEDPGRVRPDDARAGDPLTLLVAEYGERCRSDSMEGMVAMFCPHQPAPIIRRVGDGLQVRVPQLARSGPIAIVRREPDFSSVQRLIAEYAGEWPLEWGMSIFAVARMDVWAYPEAFGPPRLEILPIDKRNAGALSAGPRGPAAAAGPNTPAVRRS
jgi:hypothetical protein